MIPSSGFLKMSTLPMNTGSVHLFCQVSISKTVPRVEIRAEKTICRAPGQRPPVALRYVMWTLAASVAEKFMDLRDHFYQRARKYMEADYLKGHGEHMISIAHAQTHALLASYEFKMMYFPRAWMSTGSAIRMCQM